MINLDVISEGSLSIGEKNVIQDSTLNEYHSLHKQKLINSNLIDSNFHSLKNTATMKEAAILFLQYHLSAMPVVDEMHSFLGMLSSTAIIRSALDGSLLNESIVSYYEKNTHTFCVNDVVMDIIPFFRSTIPIVDEKNALVGIIRKESVIKNYIQSLEKIESLEYAIEWSNVCFDAAYEGIVLVDRNGIICMYNEAYSRFVGIKKETMIGKHISAVVVNSGMPKVLKTGIPERNYVHVLNGQEMIVHRIPIWKNNRVYGAIGMLVYEGFTELSKILDQRHTLQVEETLQVDKRNKKLIFRKIAQQKKEIVSFDQIIGKNMIIARAKEIARRAAKTPATILITGESGVGKELFANAIHCLSDYRDGPFICVNCASIPESLLESELFGYVEGSFTGAKKQGKPGKFELAHNGTIFLDEIGDMPLHLQSKILRVLQEREVERVGEAKVISVNFRVISATNCSLKKKVKEKTFREDLFYRLNIISIVIPPLREMATDIPLLVAHFLPNICEKFYVPQKKIDEEAMVVLMNYSWPGNLRELINVIEQLVALVEGPSISVYDLPPYLIRQKSNEMNKESEHCLNSQWEPQHKSFLQMAKESGSERGKVLILQALIEEGGNKTLVAKKLGISRATLYKKITELNIS